MNILIKNGTELTPFDFIRTAWQAYKHHRKMKNCSIHTYDKTKTNTSGHVTVRVRKQVTAELKP